MHPMLADREVASRSSRAAQFVWVMLAGATAFHLWYIRSGTMDLAPDEAHYWEWSRRLDWSYYSKGPLVAYLIAASTRLGGHSELAVRLPAVVLALGTGIVIYFLTRSLCARQRAAALAVLTAAALPLYAAGSILMTTDAPLVFLWTLAMFSVWKATASPAPGYAADVTRWRWWLVLAASLGLGVLAKYTMLLFVPCLAAYLYSSPTACRYLRRKEPYVALFAASLFFIPVLVWNAEHGWVSVRHVMGLAGLSPAPDGRPHFTLKTVFEFLGTQLIVVSPLLLIALVAAMVRSGRLGMSAGWEAHRFVFMFSAPVFGFFLLWSVYEKLEANWAAFAYVGAVVALAGWWEEQLRQGTEKKGRVIRNIAVILLPGFLLVLVGHFPGALRGVGIALPSRLEPTHRLQGWKELGRAVERRRAQDGGRDPFIMSDHYQIASELAFYVPGHPPVYNINLGRRLNQYDIWGGLEARRGEDALFVTYGDWPPPRGLHEACTALDKLEVVETLHLGQVAQVFSIFQCAHYRGSPGLPGVTY
jgi:4-amino-4-deoxy-L-arabinose transferase-like glycosyltransferase